MTHKLLIAVLAIFCLASCKSEGVWEEFEDPIFITYLHEHYDIPITENGRIDLDNDDTLRALGKITSLYLNEKQCISLAGINNLVSLTSLSCDGNRLTSLDVSYLHNLSELRCIGNYLKSINVSGCEKLDVIYCRNNQLKKLDIRRCSNLKHISCVSQTDDKNNVQILTLIMSPEMKQIWEESWAEYNHNVNAIFKE